MVVMTAKVSKVKLIIAVLLVLAVILFAVIYLQGSSMGNETDGVRTSDINTNEQRIAFLSSYGWEVTEQPIETEAILIPEELNDVLTQYNELQKSQNFDLTDYAGKQAKRYVYEVTNYKGAKAPVYATLLIHQGTVIGGDITLTEDKGLMHGFSMPETESQSQAQPETAPQSQEANSKSKADSAAPTDTTAVPQSETPAA